MLNKVIEGEYSLDEFRDHSSSIKKKHKVQLHLIKGLAPKDWAEVERRFPEFVTEAKVASFKDITFKRSGVPEVC